jgi:glucan-binding YG repeat protein
MTYLVKSTLDKWAKEINEGSPKSNKVTYHHDRSDVKVVGVGVKGTAKVDQLPDGEYGLYVETIVNKAHELFNDIQYEYNIGALDSFSIEYTTPEGEKEGDSFRILDDRTELYGWTLASRPVNNNAVMIKELITHATDRSSNAGGQEDIQMAEEQIEKVTALEAQLKELQEKISAKEEAELKAKDQAEADKKAKAEEDAKKKKDEEMKAKEDLLGSQIKELKEAIAKVTESKEAKLNPESKENGIRVEVKELDSVFSKKDVSYKELAANVGTYLSKRGLSKKEDLTDLSLTRVNAESDFCSKYFVNKVEGKEVLQFKGLSVGDNVNSNYVNATTNIGLSQAELQDVVMPVIFNALNERTVTWDLLSKDNMASQGTNRVTFVLKTGNSGAYFSKGNAITTTTTDREKYSIEYKKLYIGGAVDGDLQAFSRGGPFGEALALEMADRAIAMKVKANQALFDENAGNKSGAEPLGIPAITDSAGNTTLYDTTRSATNKLSPDAAGDTYVTGAAGLTEPMLRDAIEQATTDGSDINDLVFVGTPAVINKYKALFDNKERLVPYSDRAGFKNAPDFEGVPLFADKDSKASSLFLIDTKALRALQF